MGQPAGQFSTGVWCPHYRGRKGVVDVGGGVREESRASWQCVSEWFTPQQVSPVQQLH